MSLRKVCVAWLLVAATAWGLTTPEQRSADLTFVRARLTTLHPNFFSVTSVADFEAAASDVAERVEGTTDEQFYTGLIALVAMARDGHTAISLPTKLGFDPLPVAFRWLDDGMFVIAAEAGLAELHGARLISINGQKIEAVIEAVRPLVSFENEWWFRNNAPNFVGNLGVLRGLGIVPPGEPARVSFLAPGGRERTVELGARSSALIPSSQQVPGFVPVMLQRPGQDYWAEYWPSTRTLYVAYRRCREMPGKPIRAFAAEIIDLAQRGPIDTAIVDLRGNSGGSSIYFNQLFDAIGPALIGLYQNPDFRAWGLIDRGVFSSGLSAAEDLLQPVSLPPSMAELQSRAKVILIGEPTGGKPTHYGEVQPFALPGTGISGQHSTRLFHAPSYVPDKVALEPTIKVPVGSGDYFARHDAVLMTAIARPPSESVQRPTLQVREESDVTQPGVITNEDGELNGPERRAAGGSLVKFRAANYRWGEHLRAWIGQLEAEVVEIQPVEGALEIVSLTVRVPAGLSAGPNPLVIASGGALSNAVSVWTGTQP